MLDAPALAVRSACRQVAHRGRSKRLTASPLAAAPAAEEASRGETCGAMGMTALRRNQTCRRLGPLCGLRVCGFGAADLEAMGLDGAVVDDTGPAAAESWIDESDERLRDDDVPF